MSNQNSDSKTVSGDRKPRIMVFFAGHKGEFHSPSRKKNTNEIMTF